MTPAWDTQGQGPLDEAAKKLAEAANSIRTATGGGSPGTAVGNAASAGTFTGSNYAVACPTCAKVITVYQGSEGRLFACPLCAGKFVAPKPGMTPPAATTVNTAGSSSAITPAPVGPPVPAWLGSSPTMGLPGWLRGPSILDQAREQARRDAITTSPAFQLAVSGGVGPAQQVQEKPLVTPRMELPADTRNPREIVREDPGFRAGKGENWFGQNFGALKSLQEYGQQDRASSPAERMIRDMKEHEQKTRQEQGDKSKAATRQMQEQSDAWNNKPVEMLIRAGMEFYDNVRKAGLKVQEALSYPSRFAGAWGVDKANPNAMGVLDGSRDLLMAQLGRAMTPLITGAANMMNSLAQSRVVRGAADLTSSGLNTLGGAWRWGLNLPSGLLGEYGKWGDGIMGKPEDAPRSNRGLPQARIGSMESWWDSAQMQSLQLGVGTQESKLLAEQVENMSKTMGGLLEKIEQNTSGMTAFR